MKATGRWTRTRIVAALVLAVALAAVAGLVIRYSLLAAGEPTPTPTPCLGCAYPPSSFSPSVTPLPISQIIDLAPKLRLEDKARVIVRRRNGQYVEFQAPPEWHQSQLPLQEGDTIVYIYPPASTMGRRPYVSTPNLLTPIAPRAQPTITLELHLPPPPTMTPPR